MVTEAWVCRKPIQGLLGHQTRLAAYIHLYLEEPRWSEAVPVGSRSQAGVEVPYLVVVVAGSAHVVKVGVLKDVEISFRRARDGCHFRNQKKWR